MVDVWPGNCQECCENNTNCQKGVVVWSAWETGSSISMRLQCGAGDVAFGCRVASQRENEFWLERSCFAFRVCSPALMLEGIEPGYIMVWGIQIHTCVMFVSFMPFCSPSGCLIVLQALPTIAQWLLPLHFILWVRILLWRTLASGEVGKGWHLPSQQVKDGCQKAFKHAAFPGVQWGLNKRLNTLWNYRCFPESLVNERHNKSSPLKLFVFCFSACQTPMTC